MHILPKSLTVYNKEINKYFANNLFFYLSTSKPKVYNPINVVIFHGLTSFDIRLL